jgi:hypothetical protein
MRSVTPSWRAILRREIIDADTVGAFRHRDPLSRLAKLARCFGGRVHGRQVGHIIVLQPSITAQATRAILRWRAVDLAEKADGPVPIMPANARAVRQALEAAGLVFIDPNGGEPGVRLAAG